jgi:hypothetical protein
MLCKEMIEVPPSSQQERAYWPGHKGKGTAYQLLPDSLCINPVKLPCFQMAKNRKLNISRNGSIAKASGLAIAALALPILVKREKSKKASNKA